MTYYTAASSETRRCATTSTSAEQGLAKATATMLDAEEIQTHDNINKQATKSSHSEDGKVSPYKLRIP